MFNINELEFLKNVLIESETQDKMILSLIDKIDNVVKTLSECKQCLWSFYYDCRYGEICGLFKATEEEVKELIGKEVYFGEVLGKHSEVYGSIEPSDIMLVSDEPLEVLLSFESGYNPLEYIK